MRRFPSGKDASDLGPAVKLEIVIMGKMGTFLLPALQCFTFLVMSPSGWLQHPMHFPSSSLFSLTHIIPGVVAAACGSLSLSRRQHGTQLTVTKKAPALQVGLREEALNSGYCAPCLLQLFHDDPAAKVGSHVTQTWLAYV